MSNSNQWIKSTLISIDGYSRVIEQTIGQLDDQQLFQPPAAGFNSVANILRHLGGNLTSRWTNFMTEDGEKPNRNRDTEFEPWTDGRAALEAYFQSGWQNFRFSIENLSDDDLQQTIYIRGEAHTVPQAITRSLTHASYHVGQIVMVARMAFNDDENWQWSSIKPGHSQQHNKKTWGTSAARSVQGENTNES